VDQFAGLLVCGELRDRVFEVPLGGPGVDPGGAESAVPHQFGDGDDVDAVAEVGREGVPQEVRGDGRLPVVIDEVGVGWPGGEELVDGAG
jgi:hypothetical protein